MNTGRKLSVFFEMYLRKKYDNKVTIPCEKIIIGMDLRNNMRKSYAGEKNYNG